MLMTIGNLLQEPSAGLLFVDWDSGTVLHVTGRASVAFVPGPDALPGAERELRLEVDAVVERPHASRLRWSPPQLSRHDPLEHGVTGRPPAPARRP